MNIEYCLNTFPDCFRQIQVTLIIGCVIKVVLVSFTPGFMILRKKYMTNFYTIELQTVK